MVAATACTPDNLSARSLAKRVAEVAAPCPEDRQGDSFHKTINKGHNEEFEPKSLSQNGYRIEGLGFTTTTTTTATMTTIHNVS